MILASVGAALAALAMLTVPAAWAVVVSFFGFCYDGCLPPSHPWNILVSLKLAAERHVIAWSVIVLSLFVVVLAAVFAALTLFVVLAVLAALAAVDGCRPPSCQWNIVIALELAAWAAAAV